MIRILDHYSRSGFSDQDFVSYLRVKEVGLRSLLQKAFLLLVQRLRLHDHLLQLQRWVAVQMTSLSSTPLIMICTHTSKSIIIKSKMTNTGGVNGGLKSLLITRSQSIPAISLRLRISSNELGLKFAFTCNNYYQNNKQFNKISLNIYQLVGEKIVIIFFK